ncbi:MAG: hypothetical protein J6D03_00535 [Clostridia bacterium]|nr:hypothetical protein [Clostridia bacterium]
MKLNKKSLYVILFALLYLCTAFISTTHAISFFNLANVGWMAIILAITFEIGQAAVLFSILTDSTNRKKIMPWCLMCVLTLVQILGNVFSSYKYILTNSILDLKYFKEPIFVWTDLPDNITTVIVTYLIGGCLPLICLMLTSMVTGYLDNEDSSSNNDKDKIKELEIELEDLKNKPETPPQFVEIDNPDQIKQIESLNRELEELKNRPEPEPQIIEKEVIKEVDNPKQTAEIERLKNELELANNRPEPEPQIIEKEVIKEVDNPEQIKKIEELNKKIEELESSNKPDKESHFVNI